MEQPNLNRAISHLQKINNKYPLVQLLLLADHKSIVGEGMSMMDIKKSEGAMSFEIKNRLRKMYKIYRKDVLELWGCKVLTNSEFDELDNISRINYYMQTCLIIKLKLEMAIKAIKAS